eukprot:5162340-Karenia_brevis.AAC.1
MRLFWQALRENGFRGRWQCNVRGMAACTLVPRTTIMAQVRNLVLGEFKLSLCQVDSALLPRVAFCKLSTTFPVSALERPQNFAKCCIDSTRAATQWQRPAAALLQSCALDTFPLEIPVTQLCRLHKTKHFLDGLGYLACRAEEQTAGLRHGGEEAILYC